MHRLPHDLDLGASGNIVVRLSRKIPRNINHKLFFDNYYTSLGLLVYLSKQGIPALGTVRGNRIPSHKVITDEENNLKLRGDSVEYISTIDAVDITCVSWKDNKVVRMLSTFVGEQPISSVQRYDKSEKKTVQVPFPQIIRQYNKYMGV